MQANSDNLQMDIYKYMGQLESEHICLIYEDRDQEFAAIAQFIAASVAANRRCLMLSSFYTQREAIEILRQEGHDFSDAVESAQLVIASFKDEFITDDKLDISQLKAFLDSQLRECRSNGFENMNLVVDMSWAYGSQQQFADLIQYEIFADNFIRENHTSGMCCYSTEYFSDQWLSNIVASHRLILVDGKLTRNKSALPFERIKESPVSSFGSIIELLDKDRSSEVSDNTPDIVKNRPVKDELAEEKDWILNIAKESFILYGPDANIIWANNSAGLTAAMEPEEMVGNQCSVIRGCDGSNCPNCPVKKVKDTGKPAEGELSAENNRCMYLRVYPVYDEQANMTHIIEYGRDITERKQAEMTLRGTLSELNAINSNVPIAIILLDSNLKIRKLNQAAAELTGHDPLEILGHLPGEVLGCLNSLENPAGCGAGKDCAYCTLRSSVEHTLKTGQPHHNVEGWLPFTQGDEKHYKCMLISSSKLNLLDEDMILLSIQDITNIKKTEQELHLAEIRNRKIIDSSPMFITLVRDGKYIYANPAAAESFGYSSPDKMIDMPVNINISDKQLSIIEGIAEGIDDRQRARCAELQLSKTDGIYFNAEVLAVSAQFQDGEALLIMGSDISEHIKTRQALIESQQRFRSILETIDLYAVMLDREGNIFYVNPHYCQQTGWNSDEVIGKSWFDHLPDDRQDDIRELFYSAIETGQLPAHREDMITTRTGQHRHVVWNNVILRNSNGSPTGTASIGMDITEHRRLEQQYQQSQKMEAIGRLAAGVAHDFNNQLTVIQGYCEMLLSGVNDDDPRYRPLSEINRASLRAYATTSHLLSFSRKQLLNPEVIELDKLLQDLRNPVSKMIGEDIRLSVITTEGLNPVKIDRSGMHQALMNLMVNARDAMPDGGRLTIKATNIDLENTDQAKRFQCSSPGKYVLLEISDTGTGMDSEVMDKLFEPFFTTKEVGKGTGLGLPMVQGFVKQSSGFISVSSQPGEGTTFSILLPPAKEAVKPSSESKKGANVLGKGSETILVVEDEESVRMLLTDLLGMCGYDVHVAESFDQAVEIADSLGGKYDMLLTDMVMPEINGTELASRMADKYGEVPTLFMTGYASSKVRGEATNILTKPFTPESITSAIRKTLQGETVG